MFRDVGAIPARLRIISEVLRAARADLLAAARVGDVDRVRRIRTRLEPFERELLDLADLMER